MPTSCTRRLSRAPNSSVFLAILAGFIFAPGHVSAGTVVLQGSSGGQWTGTANSCTYSGITTDSSGNVVVNCVGGGSEPVNGVCGTANGQTVPAKPAGGAACSAGTLTAMNTPGVGQDYTWTCAGINGGASANCSAHQAVVNGACGAANGVAVSSAPTANLCVAGSTPTTVSGSGPWTWGCNGSNGGSNTSVTACSAPKAASGACGTLPSNFVVVEPGASIYGGTWKPNTSGSTYLAQIPAGSGVALKFAANPSVYPFGFKISDSTGGSTSYTVSRCPGSTTPVDGQNGTTSVNGDARKDSCLVVGGYARWINTSGSGAIYYAGSGLGYQTTCFLPTTTALGSGTAATYYINILNKSSTSAVGVQYANQPQGN